MTSSSLYHDVGVIFGHLSMTSSSLPRSSLYTTASCSKPKPRSGAERRGAERRGAERRGEERSGGERRGEERRGEERRGEEIRAGAPHPPDG